MHFEAEGGDEVGGQRRTIGFLFLQGYIWFANACRFMPGFNRLKLQFQHLKTTVSAC